MSAFDGVDLAALPPPDLVEELNYETILASLLDDLRDKWPAFDALVESDPAIKLAEVSAYLAFLLRQRVNDAARAVLLPTSTGADLDNLAALFGVARLVIDPGDADAAPPVPPKLEDDPALRRRAQLALEASTAAGTKGRYLFYALGADPLVADAAVSAHDPSPGDVTIAVLSADPASWIADAALISAVNTIVQADDVRALCDTVIVTAAQVIDYEVEATITYLPGAAAEAAESVATERIEALAAERRLGRDLTRSAVFAALHAPGVHNVVLTKPAADVIVGPLEAARCTSITLSNGGIDE
ncbi:MAG: baseplate J/gp47 family protein [Pseudomonadota bacterium]